MLTALRNVRYRSNSGKHLLALSFSGFDPLSEVWRFVADGFVLQRPTASVERAPTTKRA
jgi:hypothetical protein